MNEYGYDEQDYGWAMQEAAADIAKEDDHSKSYEGRTLIKLSYTDLLAMGIPEETLDRQLFGSDYSYYRDMENGDIYEFEGDHFMGHWKEIVFKIWFCED